MIDEGKFVSWVAGILIVGFGLAIAVGIAQPYFEARAFNKFTDGPKATYWDALWTELRVMAE